MSGSVDLSIILVTWNMRELVLDCLASIEAAELGVSYEIILVDNGSSYGVVEAVGRQFPRVQVIALPHNLGFAAGNNQGLLKMSGRHALLLNSDTIVLRGGLERCVSFLDEHPGVGIVGPQLLNSDRTKQNCIHSSPTLVSELLSQSLLRRLLPGRYPSKRVSYSEPIEVEAVLGACLFVRGEVIQEVGPLSEDYFFFLEDTDWCHRVRARSWKVAHIPDAHVIHLSGKSSKLPLPLRTRIEYCRSRYTFFRKHRGVISCWALLAIVVARVALGSVLGGRRAREYRKILAWHWRGRPASAGLSAGGQE